MGSILSSEEIRKGYRLLFDGKTLDGWDATGNSDGWAVKDDAIVCMVKGGEYLYTKDRFEDFILEMDYKTDANVNSGIFFRWSDLSDPVNTGLELQILDTFDVEQPGNKDSGAIYDLLAPKENAVKPIGEWNHVKIHCLKNKINVHLNDIHIIDMDINHWLVPGENPGGTANKFTYAWSDMPRSGHIGLQDHGGRAIFKDIKILPL